jgi:outer membrane lipoprotein-sorting protein
MKTSMMRRLLGGMLALLLVSGVAGAQTPTPTEIAATRVQANAGDADSQSLLG